MDLRINDATPDTNVTGTELLPVSDNGLPRSVSTQQIADLAISLLKASSSANFSTSGLFLCKIGSDFKVVSGDGMASAILASAFATSGVTSIGPSDKFVLFSGGTVKTVSFSDLSSLVISSGTFDFDISDLDSADPLSGDELFIVEQTTNKKLTLGNLRAFVLSGLATFLSATTIGTPTDSDALFYVNGGTVRKYTIGSLKAVLGNVRGPSTTTENKIPQWDSSSGVLKDGLVIQTSMPDIPTNGLLTDAAIKNYVDSISRSGHPSATSAGNVPTYSDTQGSFDSGMGVSQSISSTSAHNTLPTSKAVYDIIHTLQQALDSSAITIPSHSSGNIPAWGTGRAFSAGYAVSTLLRASGADNLSLPTEKAVRDAIDAVKLTLPSHSQGFIPLWDTGNAFLAGLAVGSTVRALSSASQDVIPTELAVRNAIDAVKLTLPTHTQGNIPLWDAGNAFQAGVALVTAISVSNASDRAVATEKAVRDLVDSVNDTLDEAINGKADSAHTHSSATTSAPGFMSAADKVKLNNLNNDGDLPDLPNNTLADTFKSKVTNASGVSAVATFAQIWSWIAAHLGLFKLDDLATPDDNSDLDASTSAHGLCPKLSGNASQFLNGQGSFATPPGSATFTGDSGEGGTAGQVPAPPAGSASSGLFLKANGQWAEPPSAAGVDFDDKDDAVLDSADELLVNDVSASVQKKATVGDLAAHVNGMTRYDTVFIPAGAMCPSGSDGASAEAFSVNSSNTSHDVLRFLATKDTYAEFNIVLPDDWDCSSLRAKIHWVPYNSDGGVGQYVRFALCAFCLGDSEAVSRPLGIAANIDDQMSNVGVLHVTSTSSDISIGGTPAAGKLIHFKLARDHDYNGGAGVALATDVCVLGVVLQYGRSTMAEAWS